MKRNILQEVIVWLVIILPLVYFFWVFDSLPEKVPVHFGFSGQPDSLVPKGKAWLNICLIAVASAVCYLLIKNLAHIDPKKTARISLATSQKIAVGAVFFLSAISFMTIYSTIHGRFILSKMLNPLTGLFFMYIGNLMHSLKPNYFVGLRIPWTLENEDNWKATHQMGSKLWVAGGFFMIVSSLLLPENTGAFVFAVCIGLMVTIPTIYSFRYFKTHRPHDGQGL